MDFDEKHGVFCPFANLIADCNKRWKAVPRAASRIYADS
jgi:hypothetical protein